MAKNYSVAQGDDGGGADGQPTEIIAIAWEVGEVFCSCPPPTWPAQACCSCRPVEADRVGMSQAAGSISLLHHPTAGEFCLVRAEANPATAPVAAPGALAGGETRHPPVIPTDSTAKSGPGHTCDRHRLLEHSTPVTSRSLRRGSATMRSHMK